MYVSARACGKTRRIGSHRCVGQEERIKSESTGEIRAIAQRRQSYAPLIRRLRARYHASPRPLFLRGIGTKGRESQHSRTCARTIEVVSLDLCGHGEHHVQQLHRLELRPCLLTTQRGRAVVSVRMLIPHLHAHNNKRRNK